MTRGYFILGLSDVELKSWEKELLSNLRPAGVILYARNFDYSRNWYSWYLKLVNSILNAIGSEKFLLCIDHEGGRVHRLPPPFTHFPAANMYKDHALEVGKQMGRELKEIGINLNFAPCVDVLTNPKNTVIGNRAFSDQVHTVILSSRKFLEGMQSEGVFGCYKHYPGHGGTETDSHLVLPEVNMDFNILKESHLAPYFFRPESLNFIMTAHVIYPGIDSKVATMSEFFLKKILREEAKFNGFVLSDDIEMKALKDFWSENLNFFKEIKKSGCDMIICSNNDWIFRSCFEKIIRDNQLLDFSIPERALDGFQVRLKSSLDLKVFLDGKRILEKIERESTKN